MNTIKEIWLIDDGVANGELLRTNVLVRWIEVGTKFIQFTTAKEAIDELFTRHEQKSPWPDVLFVDGNLTLDVGEFRYGQGFVGRVRSIDSVTQPKILAFSSSDYHNAAMLEAGADQSISKTFSLRDIEEALQDK